MTDSRQTSLTPLPTSGDRSSRLLTIPNLLCAVRIAGSPGLVVLGIAEVPYWFLGLYVVLAATDWLDGKLAVWLDQKSRIGPRLDSIADLTLYASLLIGGGWLVREPLWDARIFVVAAVASYCVSLAASYAKFQRFPAYHTRAAKTSWFLTLAAAVGVLLFEAEWMLLVPLIAVTLTNVEAVCITCVVDAPISNVPSIWHALRRRAA